MNGSIYVSTNTIRQNNFDKIVDDASGEVKILTGTHGYPEGDLEPEIEFFNSEFARWGSKSNVEVLDISKMSEDEINNVINSKSTIICAWCYSERSTAVLKALGLIK